MTLEKDILWKGRTFRADGNRIVWTDIGGSLFPEANWFSIGDSPIVGFRRVPRSDDIVFLTGKLELWRLIYCNATDVPFKVCFEAYDTERDLPIRSERSSTKGPMNTAVDKILEQRDEILEAFIAKYGYEPDQCVQIVTTTENQVTWSVKHKTLS